MADKLLHFWHWAWAPVVPCGITLHSRLDATPYEAKVTCKACVERLDENRKEQEAREC